MEAVDDVISTASGVPVIVKDNIQRNGRISDMLTGISCRDALAIVTSVLGGFATEAADGSIEIHKFKSTPTIESLPDRSIAAPELGDNDFEMTGIKVTTPTDTYTSGSPIRQAYTNTYMNDDLFAVFAANIVGYTFRPGTVRMALGDPRIEPWDVLNVLDVDDNYYSVPCHQITHTFDGGFSTEITAVGESATEVEPIRPIMSRIAQVEAIAKEAQEAAQSGLTFTVESEYSDDDTVILRAHFYRNDEDVTEQYPSTLF